LRNVYALQGCSWTVTTSQKFDAYPNGRFDSVEVVVFDKLRESWAQAEGEPITGFVPGAQYNESDSTLWFNCGRGGFCLVRGHIASSRKRAATVLQLAQLVEKRLR